MASFTASRASRPALVAVVVAAAAAVGIAVTAGAIERFGIVHGSASAGANVTQTRALAPQRATPFRSVAAASTADWWRYAQVTLFIEALAAPQPAPPRAPVAEAPVPPPLPAPAPAAAAPAAPPSAPPVPAPAAPPAAPAAAAPAAPAPPPPAPVAVASGLDTSPMDPMSQQLFADTNARRASAGLPPLRASASLVGVARIRSQDMAAHNYFAHTSPVTGDTAFSLMDRYGVPYGWAGENLAKNNYPDGQSVGVADEALWNSPPHRENILNPHYTDVGIALVIDGNGVKYFTIVFTGPA